MAIQSNNPLISTIITVHNGADYISEALQSIFQQEYKNIEIIVVDDGSTDKTATLIKSYGKKVIYSYQHKTGIAAGKNRGIEIAGGEYFAFLDADDLWTPGKISTQHDCFINEPMLDIVFGNVEHFYCPDLSETERSKYHCPEKSMPGISSITMLIKRQSFFKVGMFDTKYRRGIFNDWYLRACEIGLKSHVHPDVMLKRRIHRKNHGIVNKDKSVDYVRMLKASLDRKRKTN